MILPGATVGVVGGGQLGRMFTLRALSLGYRVVVLDPDPQSPAGAVASRHIRATYVDPAALPAADTRFCFGIPTPHSRVVNGIPLPPDHVAQLRALADRIQNDPSESVGMRRAANCAMYSVRGR